MIRFIIGVLLSASAALAFAPDHYVVVDGAVLYDEDHNYEDDYIIARLPYWTPVEAEPVGSPESARTYCFVKLADGRSGLTEWDYLGRRLVVVVDDIPLSGVPKDVPAEIRRLTKGESLALAPPGETPGKPGFVKVVDGDGLVGWVPEDAVETSAEGGE
jgi:hypothetical protein